MGRDKVCELPLDIDKHLNKYFTADAMTVIMTLVSAILGSWFSIGVGPPLQLINKAIEP